MHFRSKDKKRSRSREKRSRSRDRRKRSRDRDRERVDRKRDKSRSPRKRSPAPPPPPPPSHRRKSRSPYKRRRSHSPRPFRRGRTPPNGLGDRTPPEDLDAEERDARTVFCMQLSQRIRARDLEEFFSSVGKVRDVRLITCNKTKRFKGIAYIEFRDPESVPLVGIRQYSQCSVTVHCKWKFICVSFIGTWFVGSKAFRRSHKCTTHTSGEKSLGQSSATRSTEESQRTYAPICGVVAF